MHRPQAERQPEMLAGSRLGCCPALSPQQGVSVLLRTEPSANALSSPNSSVSLPTSCPREIGLIIPFLHRGLWNEHVHGSQNCR